MKYVESTDKTEKESWNNFYTDAWTRFLESVKPLNVKFVDLVPEFPDKTYHWGNYWKNKEDTTVILIDFNSDLGQHDSLMLVQLVLNIQPDEFSYIGIEKNKYILRMWWD